MRGVSGHVGGVEGRGGECGCAGGHSACRAAESGRLSITRGGEGVGWGNEQGRMLYNGHPLTRRRIKWICVTLHTHPTTDARTRDVNLHAGRRHIISNPMIHPYHHQTHANSPERDTTNVSSHCVSGSVMAALKPTTKPEPCDSGLRGRRATLHTDTLGEECTLLVRKTPFDTRTPTTRPHFGRCSYNAPAATATRLRYTSLQLASPRSADLT